MVRKASNRVAKTCMLQQHGRPKRQSLAKLGYSLTGSLAVLRPVPHDVAGATAFCAPLVQDALNSHCKTLIMLCLLRKPDHEAMKVMTYNSQDCMGGHWPIGNVHLKYKVQLHRRRTVPTDCTVH